MYRIEHKIKMFNKQTSVVKIFWDNENINKLLYGGGILYVIYSIGYKFILFSLSGY